MAELLKVQRVTLHCQASGRRSAAIVDLNSERIVALEPGSRLPDKRKYNFVNVLLRPLTISYPIWGEDCVYTAVCSSSTPRFTQRLRQIVAR